MPIPKKIKKMKKIQIILLLTVNLFFIKGFSQTNTVQLSDQAEVSLLSSDPGYYLFEAFGHSSMRISDRTNRIDLVYNYGAFNFFQKNFYFNFAKGYMLYFLGVRKTDVVFADYYRRGVEVRELKLNLTQEEKQRIFDFLQENRKEENKYYYYDYFYDNCATKYRDILQETFKEKLTFVNPQPDSIYSIRELMKRYTGPHQWGQFGIDLALGSKIDEPESFQNYMYLPDFLELGFDNAKIMRNGTAVPLVKKKHVVVSPLVKVEPPIALIPPAQFTWFILAIGLLICIFDWMRRKTAYWLDITLFSIIGLAGFVLLFLWFGTNHITAANNYNLLWAVPTHFIAAILLVFRKRSTFIKYYFLVNTILSGLLMLTWGIIPQDLNGALVPIVFLLFLRSLLLYVGFKRNKP